MSCLIIMKLGFDIVEFCNFQRLSVMWYNQFFIFIDFFKKQLILYVQKIIDQFPASLKEQDLMLSTSRILEHYILYKFFIYLKKYNILFFYNSQKLLKMSNSSSSSSEDQNFEQYDVNQQSEVHQQWKKLLNQDDDQNSILNQSMDGMLSNFLQNISIPGISEIMSRSGGMSRSEGMSRLRQDLSQANINNIFNGKPNLDIDKIGIKQSIIIQKILAKYGVQFKKQINSKQSLGLNSRYLIENIKSYSRSIINYLKNKKLENQSTFQAIKLILGNELEIVKSYIMIQKQMIDDMDCKYKNQAIIENKPYHILNLSNKKYTNLAPLLQTRWEDVNQLDLSNCDIDDKAWEQLITKLDLFPNLKVLNLKSNKINKIQTGQLKNIFHRGINLLNLTSNQMSQRTSRKIAQFLISPNQLKQNQSLYIDNLNLKKLFKDLDSFRIALSFLSFPSIKKIKLSKNNLGDKELKQIFQILIQKNQHLNIQNIVLDDNNIQNIDLEVLKQLNSKKYKSSRLLKKKKKATLQDKLTNSQNLQQKKIIISLDGNKNLNINSIKKFYNEYRYSHVKCESSNLKQLKLENQKHKEDYIQIYENCLKTVQLIYRGRIKKEKNYQIYVDKTLQFLAEMIKKQLKHKIIGIKEAQQIFDYSIESYFRENNNLQSETYKQIFIQCKQIIFNQLQALDLKLNSNTTNLRLRINNIIDQTSESDKYQSNTQLLNTPLPQNLFLIKFLREQFNKNIYSFQQIKEALYYCLRQHIQFRSLKAQNIPQKINIICLTLTTMIPNILMFQIADLGGNILQNIGFTIDLLSTSTYVPSKKRWYFDILKESYMKSYPDYQKQLTQFFNQVKLPKFINGQPPILQNNTLQQIGAGVYRIVSIHKDKKQAKNPQNEVKVLQKEHLINEQTKPLKNINLVIQTNLNYMLTSTNQHTLSKGHQYLLSIIQEEQVKGNIYDEQVSQQLNKLLDDAINQSQQHKYFKKILGICTDLKNEIRLLQVAQKKKNKNKNWSHQFVK